MVKKPNVKIPAIQIIRAVVFLFLGFVIFVSYARTRDFMMSSPLFTVQDVLIDSSIQFIDVAELRRLKGRNIFKVDINKLQARIQAQYPQISQLRVVREFPDRIKVLAKKREPVFQVPLKGKFLLVDVEGVAMYFSPKPFDLPVVTGALGGQTKIVPGAPLTSKNVAWAVDLLRGFKQRRHTAPIKVTSIDMTSLNKIDIILSQTMHLIIDQDDTAATLDTLDMLAAQRKIDYKKVKYIDLRFNEPVLGGELK